MRACRIRGSDGSISTIPKDEAPPHLVPRSVESQMFDREPFEGYNFLILYSALLGRSYNIQGQPMAIELVCYEAASQIP